MTDHDPPRQHVSRATINWHALFSWIAIVVGFSVATFLLLL
jgi:hypothetical protein